MDVTVGGSRRHRPHRRSRLNDSGSKHDTAQEHRQGRQTENRPDRSRVKLTADGDLPSIRHTEGGSHFPPFSFRSVGTYIREREATFETRKGRMAKRYAVPL